MGTFLSLGYLVNLDFFTSSQINNTFKAFEVNRRVVLANEEY